MKNIIDTEKINNPAFLLVLTATYLEILGSTNIVRTLKVINLRIAEQKTHK